MQFFLANYLRKRKLRRKSTPQSTIQQQKTQVNKKLAYKGTLMYRLIFFLIQNGSWINAILGTSIIFLGLIEHTFLRRSLQSLLGLILLIVLMFEIRFSLLYY